MPHPKSRPCLLRFTYNGHDYSIEYPSISQAEKAMKIWIKKAKIQNANVVTTR
jgi:hypothetical protein